MILRNRFTLPILLLTIGALAGAAGTWYGWVREPAAEVQSAAVYWTCVMHPEIHENGPGRCPLCGMELVPSEPSPPEAPAEPEPMSMEPAGGELPEAPPRATVAIDGRRQQLIGLRTATVERRAIGRTIRAVGQLRYDETRLADITLKLEGWIRDLHVDSTGKFVKVGDPLFTLYSPELVVTQNEYLLAVRTRDQLASSQVPDARDQAERLVQTARRRLALWDLPPDEVARLEETREPQTTMLFRSEAAGFVIEKRAVAGMRAMPGDTLYRLADLSVVWLEADLYEREVRFVQVGQRATVTLDAYPGERFSGRAVYIYPYVDEPARTVRVRFELPNPRGRLKPGMYANVELTASLGDGLVVPTNAVVDSGLRQIVFLSLGDGFFEPREVTLGARLDDAVQVLRGLEAGEEVASSATFFIDSESQLRAALEGFAPAAPTIGAGAGGPALDIQIRTTPDPPRAGDNEIEVVVKDDEGNAVEGAEVTVVLFMAAMPSMNMPAMKSEARLLPVGGGIYRGTCDVSMLGRWDLTVTVSRDDRRLGSRQMSVVAR